MLVSLLTTSHWFSIFSSFHAVFSCSGILSFCQFVGVGFVLSCFCIGLPNYQSVISYFCQCNTDASVATLFYFKVTTTIVRCNYILTTLLTLADLLNALLSTRTTNNMKLLCYAVVKAFFGVLVYHTGTFEKLQPKIGLLWLNNK